MPKYTKEELSSRVNDLDIAEDLKMSLIEDITDSMVDESEELSKIQNELDAKVAEYNDLYEKYKSRFMGIASDEPPKDEEEKEVEEEENVIDIKEIM